MAALVAADVTVAVTSRANMGNKKLVFGTLKFGDGAKTYPTGGVPLPAKSKFGFVNVIDALLFMGVNGLTEDYLKGYDKTNHTLQLFEEESTAAGGSLPECDTSEAPADRTYYFMAVGS